MVLLCGLLGGALISLLVISTTLAEGSFRITSLQHANNALARERQYLTGQVAQERSSAVIAQRAWQLGMRPVGQIRFISLKTSKVLTNPGSYAERLIHVPGWTP